MSRELSKLYSPRFQRYLSADTRAELLDFSDVLMETNEQFIKQAQGSIDFTILSSREVQMAYRKSKDENFKSKLPHAKYIRLISSAIRSNDAFSLGTFALLKPRDENRIVNIYDENGKTFLALDMESKVLENERLRATSIIKKLTDYALETNVNRLILGTVDTSASSSVDRLQIDADNIIRSQDFYLSDFDFDPGMQTTRKGTA